MHLCSATIDKCRICNSKNFELLFEFKSMPLLAEPVKQGDEIASGTLTVLFCKECGYIFLKEIIDSSIYNEYIYTPQTSEDVVDYLKQFVINTINELSLEPNKSGLEIGSGDGALCREFNNSGIDFTGIEPSKILSNISCDKNKVKTYNSFMNIELAEILDTKYDLIVVRHVLEHIHDFTSFFSAIDKCLAPEGTLIIEVPYLGDIVKQNQFYAFFFEHLSYFSVDTLYKLLNRYGFFISKVKFVYPEGGSVLIYATKRIAEYPHEHYYFDGITSIFLFQNAYFSFRKKFYELIKKYGCISAYGAGQRGITLLNLMGVSKNQIIAIYDENPSYHGRITPVSSIPVYNPSMMSKDTAPKIVLILASSYDQQIRSKYSCFGKHFISLMELT